MLDLEFAELSDTGPARSNNEDYCGHLLPPTAEAAESRGWLFALADGVGGQAHGEIASRLAIDTLLTLAGAPSGSSPPEPLTLTLPRHIQTANQRVYEAAGSGARGASMATTLVACALRFDRAVVAHAGDSRCYLIRRGQAVALTRDHTVANEQLLSGIRASRETGGANLLSRSLGTDLVVNVDTSDHLLTEGDVLLLCSDGLHHSVTPDDMVSALDAQCELSLAARKLVTLANQRDGSDNVTVQIIRIRAVESVGMYRGRLYKLPKTPVKAPPRAPKP